jgi:hypothetical protein
VRHKRERITGRAVLLAISFPQHSGFGIGRRCQDQRTRAPARGLLAWCALRQRRIEHVDAPCRALEKREYLAEFRTDLKGFAALEVVETCVGDYGEQQPAADNSYLARQTLRAR